MVSPDAFSGRVLADTGSLLRSREITTFQVNVGLRCNQQCSHCHHRAGPERNEVMSVDLMDMIVEKAKEARVKTVDITGGAPEMVPGIREFVVKLRRNGHRVMFRTNLTAFLDEDYADFPEFFRRNGIEVVASLPCYLCEEVDGQRGEGVFDRSLKGLWLLNGQGYGEDGGGVLHLVYNPFGAFLPPPQVTLQADYKKELIENFGLRFTDLFTIANMPMGRFLEDLRKEGLEEAYLKLLVDNFNPSTVPNLMCLYQINIGWDGRMYDCDFNQALDMAIDVGKAHYIMDLDASAIPERAIRTGAHCFGCTAGAGSSCGGALLVKE